MAPTSSSSSLGLALSSHDTSSSLSEPIAVAMYSCCLPGSQLEFAWVVESVARFRGFATQAQFLPAASSQTAHIAQDIASRHIHLQAV